jgi:hypothetical protein
MKIKCTQHIEAEITWNDQLEITEKTLRRILDWPDHTYVSQDGRLITDVIYSTSHAWTDKVELRKEATEDDKALQRLVNLIRASKYKYKD